MPGGITLSPDLDLPAALRLIEEQRSGQQKGLENYGKSMDSELASIYGQLKGSLTESKKTTAGIYDTGSSRVRSAYETSGGGADAASTQVQGKLAGLASQLGLDPAALAEVSGRLGEQAATFGMRNKASMADRLGSMATLGAGATAVSQFAINAAQQAEAQGRHDLALRITTEIQKANTAAAGSRSGFTAVKADQARRAAAAAEKEAMSAAKEMLREQRSAEREARSNARADAREARSSGRGNAAEARAQAKFDAWQSDRNTPAPFDQYYNDISSPGHYGPRAMSYIDARLAGNSAKDAGKMYSGLDTNSMESALGRLKVRK